MVIMRESMFVTIRQDLPPVYIMILIDAKGQVLKDALREPITVCVSTIYTCTLQLHIQIRSLC